MADPKQEEDDEVVTTPAAVEGGSSDVVSSAGPQAPILAGQDEAEESASELDADDPKVRQAF